MSAIKHDVLYIHIARNQDAKPHAIAVYYFKSKDAPIRFDATARPVSKNEYLCFLDYTKTYANQTPNKPVSKSGRSDWDPIRADVFNQHWQSEQYRYSTKDS